jgi:hypothetical protein
MHKRYCGNGLIAKLRCNAIIQKSHAQISYSISDRAANDAFEPVNDVKSKVAKSKPDPQKVARIYNRIILLLEKSQVYS